MPDDDRVLTIAEAAEIARVTPGAVRRWIMEVPPSPRLRAMPVGAVPKSRLGCCEYRIRHGWLMAFLEARADALALAHARAEFQPESKAAKAKACRGGRGAMATLKEITGGTR